MSKDIYACAKCNELRGMVISARERAESFDQSNEELITERDELRAMCDELAKMVHGLAETCPLDLYEHMAGMPCEPDGKNCNNNKGGECWKIYALQMSTNENNHNTD